MTSLSRMLAAITIVAVGLMTASTAAAQAGLTVSYYNFEYTLADLNPDDGVAPGITFSGASASAQAQLFETPDFTWPPRANFAQNAFDDGALVRFTFDSDDFHDDAYATNKAGSGTSVTGHGSSRLALASVNEFSLAPYTEVTFTAYGTVTEHSSPGTDASALLSMIVSTDDLHGGQAENRRTLSTDTGPSTGIMSMTTGTYEGPRAGSVGFVAMLSTNVLPPVPEPGTTALLAAGLALIGAAARSRRRHPGGPIASSAASARAAAAASPPLRSTAAT